MTSTQRHTLVFALSLALIVLLLVFISLDSLFTRDLPETTILHEVQLASASPPPPPATNTLDSSETLIDLSVTTVESPVMMLSMNLEVEVPSQELFGDSSANWGDGIGLDMNGVGASDLDSIPTVIIAPLLAYPKEVEESGVTEFEVVLHILIDENGDAYLVKILENPFPIMNKEVEAFVAGVRFSPPTLLGIKVKANHRWTLVVNVE